MAKFNATFSYKLIYVFRINDETHKDLLKIGDATVESLALPDELLNNCNILNVAAKARINQYTQTAGISYELLHTELAIKTVNGLQKSFRDYDVHNVLLRSGIKKHTFNTDAKQNEWFCVDLETVKAAIAAVKKGQLVVGTVVGTQCIASQQNQPQNHQQNPIIFRPEQMDAIEKTIKRFKKGNDMLWNAKMRFGKTLSALEVAKRMKFKKTIILTHRPVVKDGWAEDFEKIFYDTDYQFGKKSVVEARCIVSPQQESKKPFIYFASMQDLRGSSTVGGKFDKNDEIFSIDWDFIIIDEAHEGTQTQLGKEVLEAIRKPDSKVLKLSGTPFNLMNDYKEDEIYTWDYIMEQQAKQNWREQHFLDSNPYEELPQLNIFTYNLEKLLPGYEEYEDKAFNFHEFFRTWTGDVQKDYKAMPENVETGDFVHKADVKHFLDLIAAEDANSNYPYSTEQYRDFFRHSLWMVPGVKEAKALSAMLRLHPVFGNFEIVNIAGDGDEEIDTKDALNAVQKALKENDYTITLSCGRLTTGVTVRQWTAVFMLSGSASTSAASYLQTIFRVQTPANINGKMKEKCYVFDFAPDRTLKMVAEAANLGNKTGSVGGEGGKIRMGEFLNFCPVIAVSGSNMQAYDVDNMLQQLKRAYIDQAVRSGFDDTRIYNDNLLKLTDVDIRDFQNLKGIIGSTKQTETPKEVDVNKQGFTDEEYSELERIKKKPKKELSDEEKQRLEELKEKQKSRRDAISILRGISIRIPLMVYGANIGLNDEITPDNFTDIVDDTSWQEFMPRGVSKADFKKFSKYYERDVFIGATRRIRDITRSADDLMPVERIKKIAALFATFKNPDKETVLTPWRVVNMHLSDCLGGYNFFDAEHNEQIAEPRWVNHGEVTAQVFRPEARILEINSKTGLYPIYVTYSIFRSRCAACDPASLTLDRQRKLWQKTVTDNVFVICKTPMAKQITQRTLTGYADCRTNAHYFEDLINHITNKKEDFIKHATNGTIYNPINTEKNMKFDAIIGNPPYQSNDGSGASDDAANPIYHSFVGIAKLLTPQYISLIMPSKWMVGGKVILKPFRKEMMNDLRVEKLFDYENDQEIFPLAHNDGGICYFLWNNNHSGRMEYQYKSKNGDIIKSVRYLSDGGADIIIRDNRRQSFINKICSEIQFSSIVSPRKPFGINTDLFNNKEGYPEYNLQNEEYDNSLLVWGVVGIKGGAKRINGYVDKTAVRKNQNWIGKYKLFISKAYSTDALIPPEIIIAKPSVICTETFLVIGPFDNEIEQLNCHKYIHTKFFRVLLFFGRGTMQVSQEVFRFVPLQDFTPSSDIDWSKPITEIDKQLYAKYGLTEEEIGFVEGMVRGMD